jgi:hypothetical protein
MLIGDDFTIDQKRFQAPSAPESEWLDENHDVKKIMRPKFDYDHNLDIEIFYATDRFFSQTVHFARIQNRVQKIENNFTLYVA